MVKQAKNSSSDSQSSKKQQKVQKRGRPQRRLSSQNEVDEYILKKKCEVCLLKNREHQMLLCDRCDDSYHQNCLDPPVDNPSEVWICPTCLIQIQALYIDKEEKDKIKAQKVCFSCKEDLNRKHQIQGVDNQGNPIQIECMKLTPRTCLYCKHSFHDLCFSPRKNSLNCHPCQKKIRKRGPKNHDQFMEYIDYSIDNVKNSDHSLLQDGSSDNHITRHKHFRLKVPPYMTSWQLIIQYEASLYYAFTSKRLTFIDDQIYHNDQKQTLMQLNSPDQQSEGNILRLHEKDEKVYEEFKINSKKGFVGPLEVKEDRVKGFYLVSTDYIPPCTIVSEYSGEVMTSRTALQFQENDSIFMLVKCHRSVQSLDIVPEKYGNISRFFSGINNNLKRSLWTKLQNIRSLRFSYKGRVHILLYTIKPIQAGETLYFDYNGSLFHEYPTDHFVN